MSADLLGSTAEERVAKCRSIAAEAVRLASTASSEARTGYMNLARQWSILADEIENGISTPARSN
jgi:hypothetical protein